MAYNINKSDGLPLITIQDNTVDTTATSLTLFGRNVLNYGQALNQNFVNLLQNFSNKISPSNPLQGQLWYDTDKESLKIYTGSAWLAIDSPFNGVAGNASVKLDITNTDVTVAFSNNKIVHVTSYNEVPPALLPDVVVINDTRYAFKILFPNGLKPGINAVYDPASMPMFYGIASSANVLTTPRTISLVGDLSGSAVFDGSSNINIDASFSNLYVGNTNVTVSGTYTKIVVNDSGRIIGGGNISNGDVISALGYVPYSGANINVAAVGNTIVARDENGNFSANIIVGTATHAYALKTPIMIGINGDVVGAASFDGSNGIVISTQLAPIANLAPGRYSTVRVDSKGRVVSGSKTADVPIGGIIVFNNITIIPEGWVKCNGSTYPTPDGDFVTTPNLSNLTVGTSGFYIMKIF